jgi:hypothetical protein
MTDSPIAKLLRELKPVIEYHETSSMARYRYPEFAEVIRKADTNVTQAELQIEDTIRTWVYRQLIDELQQLEEYKDPSHFGKYGVDFVIQYLKKHRPELRG